MGFGTDSQFLERNLPQRCYIHALTTGGAPLTGDAANITGQLSLDDGTLAATNDTNPTELDASGAPGIYFFNLILAETDAARGFLVAKSTTSTRAHSVNIKFGQWELIEAVLCNKLTHSADKTTMSYKGFDGTKEVLKHVIPTPAAGVIQRDPTRTPSP